VTAIEPRSLDTNIFAHQGYAHLGRHTYVYRKSTRDVFFDSHSTVYQKYWKYRNEQYSKNRNCGDIENWHEHTNCKEYSNSRYYQNCQVILLLKGKSKNKIDIRKFVYGSYKLFITNL